MRLDVRAETLCAPSDIERLSLPVIKYRQVFCLTLEDYKTEIDLLILLIIFQKYA